jgi:nucleotide-binding universal stress UspA family protein
LQFFRRVTTAPLKVLVPVDFSEPSRMAMAWAFDYAQRADCELHLLHVVETTADPLELETEFRAITRAAEEELSGMAPSEAARIRIGKLHRHTATGKPADEIVEVARRLGAELVVMGTHGRTGVRRALIGSVAEETMRRAPCTVVCVKPQLA